MGVEEALQAKELLSKVLLSDEGKRLGVWGVGVTKIKFVAGQARVMDDYGVVVYVREKLSVDRVPPHLLVPRVVNVGGKPVWTDIVQGPEPSILMMDLWSRKYGYTPLQKVEAMQECSCHRSRCRPVSPGLSVADCETTACTSTGPFTDGSKIYWVTNAHCLKGIKTCNPNDMDNRPVSQPGPYDGGKCPDDVIGVAVKASDLFSDGYTDTALIEMQSSIGYTAALHATSIAFNGSYRLPNVGEKITKSGRSTGVKTGDVISIRTDVNVDYGCRYRTVKDTIVTTPILEPGDSGSPGVAEDGTFLGQGFAGSLFMSVFINPENIYREFGVKPASGAAQNKIRFYIDASTNQDSYVRFIGIGVDQDPGENFWQEGKSIGTITPPKSSVLVEIDPPSPGAHKLFVRVSTDFVWTIRVYNGLGDLGSKDTFNGLAVFDFTYGAKRVPKETSVKAVVRVRQPFQPPPPQTGEEVVLRTDKDIYEVDPGQGFEVIVYANYKSDDAPVDGYRVIADLAGKSATVCMVSGKAVIILTSPDNPGDYDLIVTLKPEECK
jgi:hypothetical protein